MAGMETPPNEASEEWRVTASSPDYEVSSWGRVRSWRPAGARARQPGARLKERSFHGLHAKRARPGAPVYITRPQYVALQALRQRLGPEFDDVAPHLDAIIAKAQAESYLESDPNHKASYVR
jgi:hypothetical protein